MVPITRRQAITRIGVGATTLVSCRTLALSAKFRGSGTVSLGVIADLHAGLAPDAAARLDQFLTAMKTVTTDALLQLGDFAFSRPAEQPLIDRFNSAHDRTLHIIGNHDIRDHGLTRADCLKSWGMPAPYYVREFDAMTMIVLDGNDKGSPKHRGGYPSYLGPQQLAWLESRLAAATKPVMIACHQPLAGYYAVDNAEAVQALLTRYRDRIVLCINGHTHIDYHLQVGGVDYLHLNSASYKWVGGKLRMARYGPALFAQLLIDFENAEIRLLGRDSNWAGQTPDDVNYFDGKDAELRAVVRPQISSRTLSLKPSDSAGP